jgi:hypothetical protein
VCVSVCQLLSAVISVCQQMTVVVIGHQQSSEVVRGCQRLSVVVSNCQLSYEVVRQPSGSNQAIVTIAQPCRQKGFSVLLNIFL